MFIVKDYSDVRYSINIFIVDNDNLHFTVDGDVSYLSPLTFSEFNNLFFPINDREYEKMIEDIDKFINMELFLKNLKKVVCISSDCKYDNTLLEINKIYDVIGYYIQSKDDILLQIKDHTYLPIKFFKPLSEYRKEKISKIIKSI